MRRAQHVFINTSSAYLRGASAIFALTIYHFLSLFTPDLKLICFTNRFLHNLSVFFSGLPSRSLCLYWSKWALAFLCF